MEGCVNHAERQTELYQGIYASDPNYGTAWLDVYDTVENRIGPHMRRLAAPVFLTIDFGAGDGRFLRVLRSAALTRYGLGVDLHRPVELPHWLAWRQQPMWEFVDRVADYAISTDALEHLPPEKVNASLVNISRAAPHGFLRISLKEDRYGTDRGLHLHESVLPAHDWLQRLRATGIELSSYRVYFDSGRREAALEVYF